MNLISDIQAPILPVDLDRDSTPVVEQGRKQLGKPKTSSHTSADELCPERTGKDLQTNGVESLDSKLVDVAVQADTFRNDNAADPSLIAKDLPDSKTQAVSCDLEMPHSTSQGPGVSNIQGQDLTANVSSLASGGPGDLLDHLASSMVDKA